jgi:hypothetical protein
MEGVVILYGHLVYFIANILWLSGIFYGYLVFLWLFGIFYSFWYIFPVFGMLYQEKSGNPGQLLSGRT